MVYWQMSISLLRNIFMLNIFYYSVLEVSLRRASVEFKDLYKVISFLKQNRKIVIIK